MSEFEEVPKLLQDIPTQEELVHIECPSCRQVGSIKAEIVPPKSKENDTDKPKYKFTCTSLKNTAGGPNSPCNLSVTFSTFDLPITKATIEVGLEQRHLGR